MKMISSPPARLLSYPPPFLQSPLLPAVRPLLFLQLQVRLRPFLQSSPTLSRPPRPDSEECNPIDRLWTLF